MPSSRYPASMVNGEPDQPVSGRFTNGTHRLPIRVYYEDTDAGGVVYHGTYLGYMERARSEMLRLAGIDQRTAIEVGIGYYLVAALAIRYRRSARLDDALTIVSRIEQIRATSCAIHQRVMRGEELVAEADVTVVFVNIDGRPRRQPAEWVESFRRLQGDKVDT